MLLRKIDSQIGRRLGLETRRRLAATAKALREGRVYDDTLSPFDLTEIPEIAEWLKRPSRGAAKWPGAVTFNGSPGYERVRGPSPEWTGPLLNEPDIRADVGAVRPSGLHRRWAFPHLVGPDGRAAQMGGTSRDDAIERMRARIESGEASWNPAVSVSINGVPVGVNESGTFVNTESGEPLSDAELSAVGIGEGG
jgi:hypothetical protein